VRKLLNKTIIDFTKICSKNLSVDGYKERKSLDPIHSNCTKLLMNTRNRPHTYTQEPGFPILFASFANKTVCFCYRRHTPVYKSDWKKLNTTNME
jgi:hypothetical protein